MDQVLTVITLSDLALHYYKEWQQYTQVGDLDRRRKGILDYVLQKSDLDNTERSDLLIALLGEDYRMMHFSQCSMPSLRNLLESYEDLISGSTIELDLSKLTRYLITIKVRLSKVEIYPSGLKLDFPEYSEFIDQFYEDHCRTIHSHFGQIRLNRKIEAEQDRNNVFQNGTLLPIYEKYEVVHSLDKGGQKYVYEVLQHSTNQHLVLKKLRADIPETRKAFRDEAKLQAKLSHPNIPTIYSLSVNEKDPKCEDPSILIERFITGKNWAMLLDERDLGQNLDTLITVSRIIAYVHHKGIIHGDLKPANVMFGEEGDLYNEIYIVDWGMAFELDEYKKTRAKRIDQKGVYHGGTCTYMPPEMVNDATWEISPATDVFMLGGILCRILTGKAPRQDEYELHGNHILDDIWAAKMPKLDLTRENRKSPEELVLITQKALSRDPADRHQNAGEFVRALERYRRHIDLEERLDRAELKQISLFSSTSESAETRTSNVRKMPKIMDQIELANELRLIRESLMEMCKGSGSVIPDQHMDPAFRLLNRVLQSEQASRSVLIDTALHTKDFGLASAQLSIADEIQKTFVQQDQTLLKSSFSDNDKALADFHTRLQHGLTIQRRERFAKWIAATVAFFLIFSLIGILYMAKINSDQKLEIAKTNEEYAKSKELSIQKDFYNMMDPIAQNATREKFGQGKVITENLIYKLCQHFSLGANQLDISSKTSLLPEKTSGYRLMINAISWSADGKYFATVDPENTLYIWDNKTLETVETYLAFYPEDSFTYVEPNPLYQNENASEAIHSSRFLLYNSSGTISLISGKEKKIVHLLNLHTTGEIPASESLTALRPVWSGTEKNDTATMLLGTAKGEIHAFSFPDGKRIKSFSTGKQEIKTLTLSRDGRFLITTESDGNIKRWDREGKLLDTFNFGFSKDPHPSFGFIRRVTFSPSGNLIAAGSESGEMVVWNIPEKKIIARMKEPHVPGTLANFLNRFYWIDETHFMSLCLNNHYCLWDLNEIDSNLCPKSLRMKSDQLDIASGPAASAVSPNGDRILIYGNDHTLRLFETRSGDQIAQTEGICKSSASFFTLSSAHYFSPANRLLTGNYSYHSLISIDPVTLRADRTFIPYDDLNYIDFGKRKNLVHYIASPDSGTEFAAAFASGDIMIFDIHDSKPKHCFKNVFESHAKNLDDAFLLAVDPQGKYLVTTSVNHSDIILLNWKDRKEIRRWKKEPSKDSEDLFSQSSLEVLDKKTTHLAFLKNNQILELTIGGVLKIWNVDNGKLIRSFNTGRKTDSITKSVAPASIAISHDKTKVAIGFNDGYFQIIKLDNFSILYGSDLLKIPLSDFNPNRSETSDTSISPKQTTETESILNPASSVTGISWAKSDTIIAIGFSSGKGVLIETKNNTIVSVIASGLKDRESASPMFLKPFFTNEDKLITIGNEAVIRSWDYLPSKEKGTVLKSGYGADSLASTNETGEWIGVRDTPLRKNAFFVYKGNKEKYTVEETEDFQQWESHSGEKYIVLLNKNGRLSVIHSSTGKPQSFPKITEAGGFPQKGFTQIRISPDNKNMTALDKEKGSVYILDLTLPNPIWKKILEGNQFVQMAISPNSQKLAAVDENGELRLWNLKTNSEQKSISLMPLQGMLIAHNQGKIRFITDHFLAQSGAGRSVIIWDADQLSIFQEIQIPIFNQISLNMHSISGLECLNKGDHQNQDPAFVVAGIDGILRFYQFLESTKKFEPIYVISSLRLADITGKSVLMEEPYMGYNQLKNFFSADMSNDEAKYEMDELKNILGEKEIKEMLSLISDTKSPKVPLVFSDRYWINDLALSYDGRTLYVGASGEVRSYDMEEIWKNIESLPQKWKQADIEALTGLRLVEKKGLVSVLKNHMRRKINRE